MKQQTLAMAEGFEKFGKKTRRALFLEEMEEVVPWGELCSLVTPYYPAAGNGRGLAQTPVLWGLRFPEGSG